MPAQSFIDTYKAKHRHPLNKLSHSIGIPMIVVSLPIFFFDWRWALGLFVVGWILQFLGHAVEGNQPAGSISNVEQRQGRRIFLELRGDLQNHLVLIVRRVNLRHLTRAVRVIERRFDLIGRQAQCRQLVAIHVDADLRVLQLQIAVHVLEARQLAQLRFENRRPVVQLDRKSVV